MGSSEGKEEDNFSQLHRALKERKVKKYIRKVVGNRICMKLTVNTPSEIIVFQKTDYGVQYIRYIPNFYLLEQKLDYQIQNTVKAQKLIILEIDDDYRN